MVPTTISAERWEQLYRLEFARVYRALLAVLRDPDRALDALHDAFVAGLRKPPAEDDDLSGWLFVVAGCSCRPGVRRPFFRLYRSRSDLAEEEVQTSLDRLEGGRLLLG